VGPLLLTGLICFAATVALGLLTSSVRPLDGLEQGAQVRGLFIVQAAFVEGMAVLGVVVGLLAVTAGHPSGALLAAGPALAGAAVGVAMALRSGSGVDRSASFVGLWFIVSVGILGVVVGVVATVIAEHATRSLTDWPFAVLGLAGAVSVLGIGWTGSIALRATDGADAAGVETIRAAQLTRCLWFEIVGLCAVGIAIAILLLA
jgi:hypothetical protein